MKIAAAALVAMLTMALGAGSVLADTELGHRHKVGPHQLNDVPENPIVCNYAGATLQSMAVPTVSLWSRDTSAGRDKRKVGWQLIVETQPYLSSDWHVVYRSPIRTAKAWDDQSAFFPARYITNSDVAFGFNDQYRVISRMIWFSQNGGNLIGNARHRHDNYDQYDGVHRPASSCTGAIS